MDGHHPRERRRSLNSMGIVAVLVVVAIVTVFWLGRSSRTGLDSCGHDLTPFHTSVFAVDARTGAPRWRHDDLPATQPARSIDGAIYLFKKTGGLLVIDPPSGNVRPSGIEDRTFHASVPPPVDDTAPPDTARPPVTPLPERPVVAGDSAYVVASGSLVAVDRATQTTRWSIPVDMARDHSFPIVFGDVVVLSQTDPLPGCV